MVKSEGQKKKDQRVFFGIFDFADFVMNFLPGKALTALLIVGAVGGYVGYDAGVGSVEIPEIPEIPECPECPVAEPCPAPEPCPPCKELTEYSDKEMIEVMESRWDCTEIPKSSGGGGGGY